MIIRPLFPSLRISSLRQLQQFSVPLAVSALLWTLGFVWSHHSSAAVLDDQPLPAGSSEQQWVAPPPTGTTTSATAEWVDPGYMVLEAESCAPLGPAVSSITALLGNSRPLATREAAMLSHHWRQVQHHKAESVAGGHAQLCYYIAQ